MSRGPTKRCLMTLEPDHYLILGVSRRATPEAVRAAYRQAARATHPDLNPGDPHAVERFKRVQRAYDVLGDQERRAAYDQRWPDPDAPLARPSVATRPSGANGRAGAAHAADDEQISLARELGETVRAIRVMARRSGLSRRVHRLIRYLERL